MVSLPAEFRASLESYNGPLDLLLFLIRKHEIDVFDIPIVKVVEQYQLFLELLQEIDPNACGEFLVMAARLMEIKSRLLLPRESVDEEEEDMEDPRIELIRQLLEYKKFKERALLLEKRLEMHRRRYHRPPVDLPAIPGEETAPPLSLGNISVWDLLTAFHRIQITLGQREPHQVVLEDRPLSDYIDEIVSRLELAASHTAAFDELLLSAQSRHDAIGFFLAILELAKNYRITLQQEGDTDGTIYVSLRQEEETRRLLETESADELRGAEGPADEAENDLRGATDNPGADLPGRGAPDRGLGERERGARNS